MSDFPIPDWSRIDVVCLDMDGTVLDLHFDNLFWLRRPAAALERGACSEDF